MIKIPLLEQAIRMLGDVIGEFDGYRRTSEANGLRSDFEAAIAAEHPKRSEVVGMLGRNPSGARDLATRILEEARMAA
ncbi:MAG: hypothetical protein AAB839_03105 [Patescibacteria group bacterium]